MATKKETRARIAAQREEFLKQVEADGLAALRADQERRKKESALAKEQEETRNREMLKKRSKPFARMAKNGKTPVKDPRKFDPDLIDLKQDHGIGQNILDVSILEDLIESRKDKPNLKKGIDLTRNIDEITVGEYLEAANKLLPVFSEK